MRGGACGNRGSPLDVAALTRVNQDGTASCPSSRSFVYRIRRGAVQCNVITMSLHDVHVRHDRASCCLGGFEKSNPSPCNLSTL